MDGDVTFRKIKHHLICTLCDKKYSAITSTPLQLWSHAKDEHEATALIIKEGFHV
jgi:hypothetical protein